MAIETSKCKAVIFDCDGVLVDSEPISNRVLVEMANELGASINSELAYQYFKGNALKNCINIISHLVPLDSPQQFEQEFRLRSFEAFKKEIRPVAHVPQVLEQIQKPFCVASSGPENKIELNLRLTGLLPFFKDRIYSCYTIKKWKPEPDVFLWAARDFGFKPDECLVVEDSAIGAEAASKGGFQVCAYIPDAKNEKLEETAHFIIDDMLKLLDIL